MKILMSIRVDQKLKESAQKAAKKMGFSLSFIINAALRRFVREKEIESVDYPPLRPRIVKILKEIEDDIKHGRNISPILSTPQETEAYLRRISDEGVIP